MSNHRIWRNNFWLAILNACLFAAVLVHGGGCDSGEATVQLGCDEISCKFQYVDNQGIHDLTDPAQQLEGADALIAQDCAACPTAIGNQPTGSSITLTDVDCIAVACVDAAVPDVSDKSMSVCLSCPGKRCVSFEARLLKCSDNKYVGFGSGPDAITMDLNEGRCISDAGGASCKE